MATSQNINAAFQPHGSTRRPERLRPWGCDILLLPPKEASARSSAVASLGAGTTSPGATTQNPSPIDLSDDGSFLAPSGECPDGEIPTDPIREDATPATRTNENGGRR